jgi:hypothetical protein
MGAMSTLHEPARDIPVTADCDLVVVGGSCTGVFAAVAAARQGLTVCLVEQLNQFGGTATASMVCVWHALWDTAGTTQISSGLTKTVLDRLAKRGAVIEGEKTSPHWQYCFRPAELAIELDELVLEHGIRPFLHARVASVVREGRNVTAVVIEDKDGRRAIRTRAVVDASGDADVLRRAGVEVRRPSPLQPPTTAALLSGLETLRKSVPNFHLGKILFDQKNPKALRSGFVWAAPQPGIPGLELVFGTRVHGADLLLADDLTRAEMAGRSQVRRMVELINDAHPEAKVALAAIPARIGIRETCHAPCLHTLTEQEVLEGTPAADAIAYGSYRVDIHPQGGGIVFRYLDGRESRQDEQQKWHEGRWREQRASDPTFYQIPYRSLVPRDLDNVLVAGRCLDADQGAYGAVRVMMVCNQLGEAAGTAAALALRNQCRIADVDTATLRTTLAANGATIIPFQQGARAR